MHVRIVRTKRAGKVREYPQLVHSYRRDDGVPAHRVIASLKDLTAVEVDNLRTALRAGRLGQRVVPQLQSRLRFARPSQNLRYLDLAVLLELWRRWGLDALLEQLLRNEADVSAADVVAALVLQRCVAPGSKLFAERWFPTTALPELLALPPKKFNNTRLHRVLDQLDRATPMLMERLSARCLDRGGPFTCLFVDVTDTWFEGHGPELAERTKTKEGRLARKVGIVLLCDDRGYPLRWQVVAGRSADNKVMHSMIAQVRQVSWTQDVPLVVDRAMGSSADIALLQQSELKFVTAIRSTEYGSYARELPWRSIGSLTPSLHEDSAADKDLTDEAGRRVHAAGMQRVHDELFITDCGVVQPDEPAVIVPSPTVEPGRLANVLWRALQNREVVSRGDYPTYNAAARALGVTIRAAKKHRGLLCLEDSVQRDVLDGRAECLSIQRLLAVAKLPEHEQRQEFDRLVRSAPAPRVPAPATSPTEPPSIPPEPVRVVAYFNPDLFLRKRRTAERCRARIEQFVAQLNGSGRARRANWDDRKLIRSVEAKLREEQLLKVYDVAIDTTSDGERYVQLRLDEAEWQRRRRYDGFSVLVAHDKLSLGAHEIVKLYRAKDLVEKDFQVIKSVVRIRPVHHCTDAKVRAHVTLCMLALLLERAAVRELGARSLPELTEVLAPCHLNRYASDADTRYLLTQLSSDQQSRLEAMGMSHLADDEVLAERIVPR